MKHILKRTVAAAILASILFSVGASAKQTYNASKANLEASVWLFADDNEPKPQKQG